MTLYLALLRGINVGGRNRVPMGELGDSLEASGFENVATYLQTGNVLFDADEANTMVLAEKLKQLINDQFGTTTPVVIRRFEDLERTVSHNPFLSEEEEFKWLHVMFLNDTPAEDDVEKLDPERSPGDRFAVDGKTSISTSPMALDAQNSPSTTLSAC